MIIKKSLSRRFKEFSNTLLDVILTDPLLVIAVLMFITLLAIFELIANKI